jgi:hypothetical protein
MTSYIYVYSDLSGVPFYVGKGKGRRFELVKHIQKGVANQFLKNKILKLGTDRIIISFMHHNSPEHELMKWEQYWIKFFGRRDRGEGTLCNLTDGGEGISGAIRSPELKEIIRKKVSETWIKRGGHSLESRQKMSRARTGLKHSQATRERMSIAAKLRFKKSGGHSQESKDKVSQKNQGKTSYWKGRSLPDEVKLKISETKRLKSQSKNNITTMMELV